MHDEYELPGHLNDALPQTLAEGVKAMVKVHIFPAPPLFSEFLPPTLPSPLPTVCRAQGANLVGSMQLRASVLGASEAVLAQERTDRYLNAMKDSMKALPSIGDRAAEDKAEGGDGHVYKTQQEKHTDIV